MNIDFNGFVFEFDEATKVVKIKNKDGHFWSLTTSSLNNQPFLYFGDRTDEKIWSEVNDFINSWDERFSTKFESGEDIKDKFINDFIDWVFINKFNSIEVDFFKFFNEEFLDAFGYEWYDRERDKYYVYDLLAGNMVEEFEKFYEDIMDHMVDLIIDNMDPADTGMTDEVIEYFRDIKGISDREFCEKYLFKVKLNNVKESDWTEDLYWAGFKTVILSDIREEKLNSILED